ncbi:MAG TPA: hypothetical protein VK203_10040 [Nostocaceae cyanobacterium]|nr:hypothetical protein [Nostocaceae cyanobacterium]
MPSKQPQMTIRLPEEEYEYLQEWASREFLTVSQMAKVILRRAIAQDKKRQDSTQE